MIVGLIHQTSYNNFVNILENKELYTNVKLWYKNIKNIEGFTVGDFTPSIVRDQFPGVYMGLITENDLDKKIKYFSPISLLFCKTLLKRDDFIYNKYDSNGFSNKDFTITSLEELNNYIEEGNFDNTNEIVFINPVSLKYLKEIWVKDSKLKMKLDKLLLKNKLAIPVYTNDEFLTIDECKEHINKNIVIFLINMKETIRIKEYTNLKDIIMILNTIKI